MTRQFTDAENTGAPMVPMETEDARLTEEGDREFLEEMVWSHRLQ